MNNIRKVIEALNESCTTESPVTIFPTGHHKGIGMNEAVLYI